MGRITISLALAIVCICVPIFGQKIEYDLELFRNKIDRECLQRIWTANRGQGEIHLLGQTLDTFISLVEQVERNHTNWNIYEVSRALLKRFAFEGIQFKNIGNDREPVQFQSAKSRWEIISKLLSYGDNVFDEADMDGQQKCSMFFMMGHLVNDTFREGIDDINFMKEVPMDTPAGQVYSSNPTRLTKQPREQGVISVNGNLKKAVAISKVLNAILALNRHEENVEVTSLAQDINLGDSPHTTINPLVGVTLADVVSLAAYAHQGDKNGLEFFGPSGEWNSTVCPTEFKLSGNSSSGITNALLRGAVDGYLIGKALKETSVTDATRLSRVLRMYYSKQGLYVGPVGSGTQTASYCRRMENLNTEEVRKSSMAFYTTFMYKLHSKVPQTNKVEETVNRAISQLSNALNSDENTDIGPTDECSNSRGTVTDDSPICETPSNVFLVLDSSEFETSGNVQQEEIAGILSSKLDFGFGTGTLNVYYDARGDSNELFAVAQNASNPSCAVCALERVEKNRLSSRLENEVVTLHALNKTLQSFELKHDLEPGVPNKAVVLFHMGELKEKDKKRLQGAAQIVHEGHRDTRVFVIGSKADGLQILSSGSEYMFTDINNGREETIVSQLAEKICKVPALFQFNRCWDHKTGSRKENENEYQGYVTPNHVQFWAYYPEYFLKSYNIKIKFTPEQGDIRVCEQRGQQNPGFDSNFKLDKNKCQHTDSNKRELIFSFKDPCHKYHVHNCPPINFAVIGISPANNVANAVACPRDDNKCRRLDQVKFKMSHEGISCSGCEFLRASPLILLLGSLFYYFKN